MTEYSAARMLAFAPFSDIAPALAGVRLPRQIFARLDVLLKHSTLK